MKRKTIFIVIMLTAVLFSACAPTDSASSDKPLIYVSFYAMHDFTRLIAGDTAEIVCLTPPGVEPHDWEPSPQDLVRLGDAELFIYSGHGMEPFIESLDVFFDERDINAVETGAAIPVEQDDPHVWLNPQYAKVQLKAICGALTAQYPSNANIYAANYEAAEKELDILDSEYRKAVEQFSRSDVVVSHMAYGYLCAAYGLNQIGIAGLSADAEPSPARMAEIIDFVRENDVRCIFFEELVSPKLAKAIAEETGVATSVLNPFEGIADESQETYFDVMRKNLGALAEALH